MTHVTHWVPAHESPRWPPTLSWLNLQLPEGYTKSFVRSVPNNIKYTWNEVCTNFLNSSSDWLWSTHSDVVFEPETLTRLLSWNKPLISALIFMRQAPIVPHIWQGYEGGGQYAHRIRDTREWFYQHREYIKFGPFVMHPRPDDALVPVEFTSTSCTLIHRSVLEKMSDECGDQWFVMDDDLKGGGEDRRFFDIAKRAGFQSYVDRSCVVGHLVGDIATSSADFIAWDSVSEFSGTGEP